MPSAKEDIRRFCFTVKEETRNREIIEISDDLFFTTPTVFATLIFCFIYYIFASSIVSNRNNVLPVETNKNPTAYVVLFLVGVIGAFFIVLAWRKIIFAKKTKFEKEWKKLESQNRVNTVYDDFNYGDRTVFDNVIFGTNYIIGGISLFCPVADIKAFQIEKCTYVNDGDSIKDPKYRSVYFLKAIMKNNETVKICFIHDDVEGLRRFAEFERDQYPYIPIMDIIENTER